VESLALVVMGLLIGIYGSGLLSLFFSFSRNQIMRVLTLILGSISITSGAWLGFTLIAGNGALISIFPVLAGAAGIFNALRKRN
jgi:uncharacterized membrane protein HdeD (DUF308 family)